MGARDLGGRGGTTRFGEGARRGTRGGRRGRGGLSERWEGWFRGKEEEAARRVIPGASGPEAGGRAAGVAQRPPPRGRSAALCWVNNNDGSNSNYPALPSCCVLGPGPTTLRTFSFNPQSNPLRWIALSPFYSSERLPNLPEFTVRKS